MTTYRGVDTDPQAVFVFASILLLGFVPATTARAQTPSGRSAESAPSAAPRPGDPPAPGGSPRDQENKPVPDSPGAERAKEPAPASSDADQARAENPGAGEASAASSYANMSLEELLNIELEGTTASKWKTKSREAPSIVTIIDRATIDAFGYRTLGEALQSVPEIFVVDDLVTSNIAVRGIHAGPDSWSRTIKFMVDGNPVQSYNTGGALVGPEFIPMDSVESIEVLRGPGSALYGANAFLGVVNVVTRKPKPGVHARVGGEYSRIRSRPGYSDFYTVSGVSEGKRPISATVSVFREHADRSGLPVPGSSPLAGDYAGMRSHNDFSNPLSVYGRVGYDAGRWGELQLSTTHQRMDARAVFSEISVLSRDQVYAQSNTTTHLNHSLVVIKDTLNFRTRFSHALGRSLDDELLDPGEVAEITLRRRRANRTYGAGSELALSLGDNSVLTGFDYVVSRDDGDRISAISRIDGNEAVRNVNPQTFAYSDVGVYAQGIYRLLQAVTFTGGVRYDVSSRWDNTFTYRAALVHSPLDSLSITLMTGTSYVPPSPAQLVAVPLQQDGGINGNPALKSQSARTYEGAITYRPIKELGIRVAGFWTEVDDRVDLFRRGSQLRAENLGTSTTYGGSISPEFRWKWLLAKADATWQRTKVDTPENGGLVWPTVFSPDVPGGYRLPNFPQIMGHVHLGVRMPEWHLQATVSGGYYGDRKSSFANSRINGTAYLLDPYQVLSFHVRTLGVHVFGDRETVFSLHGTNVTNEKYSHGGALGVDIPAVGRSLYLGLAQDI